MDYRTSYYLSKPLGKGLKNVIKIDVGVVMGVWW
jgi:hypothetical protein